MTLLPQARRGRPRDPATERAILDAALHVLERRGYAGFTIEAVARRAGSSKVTVYRRWPSAAALMLAALARHGADTVPAVTTGRLDTDVRTFFRAACVRLNGRIGLLLRGLMAEAQVDETFRLQFREDFIARRRASLSLLLEAGRARGELPADADLGLLLDMLFGAMWYRLLLGNAPLDNRFADGLADLVSRCGDGQASAARRAGRGRGSISRPA